MKSNAVNLSVDLDALFVEPTELDGDPVNVRDAMRAAVVDAAASKLVAGFDHEELHEMRTSVRELRNQLVRDRLVAEVEEAMSRPIQRCTPYGEKIGEPTTVLELIRAELEAFLNGTSVRSNRDSMSSQPRNLAELIQTVSRQVIGQPLARQVEEARRQVSVQVQAVLTEAITEKLAKK